MTSARLILHLGFHKTATTTIQHILEENADQAQENECFIVPHKRLRNNYTRVIEAVANRAIGMEFGDEVSEGEIRVRIKRVFTNGVLKNNKYITVSEENAAGHVGQCAFPGDLYRFPMHYMRSFGEHLPVPVDQVHVSVRAYDRFFASCYLEYLGSVQSPRYIPPETMMSKVMANAPSWITLIDMIRQIYPDSAVHVWVYEDFRTLLPSLMSALMNIPEGQSFTMPDTVRRRGKGQAQFDQFQRVVAAEGSEAALEYWRQISREEVEADSAPTEMFQPWSAEDRAHLQMLYAQDLETLAARPDVHLHRAEAQHVASVATGTTTVEAAQ